MNYAINGLRVLVDSAVERGTIHTMRMPPEREAFATDEDYSVAYQEWWDTMHLWSATITNIGDD